MNQPRAGCPRAGCRPESTPGRMSSKAHGPSLPPATEELARECFEQFAPKGRRSGGGPPRLSRQYLDPVVARVREIDRPAVAAVGDLIGLGLLWVGPVWYPTFADAREQGVELGISDREGVVLWRELFSGVGEIERCAARESNLVEPAPGPTALGGGSLSISARKAADARLSRDRTIRWSRCTGMRAG